MNPAGKPPSPPNGKVPIGPLASAVIAAAGGLVGALFAQCCVPFFHPRSFLQEETPADLVLDCVITCTGVILGALFFSWASKR